MTGTPRDASASTNPNGSIQLLTVPEACEALRISKWSLYRLIQEGKLASVTIGARRLVPRRSVEEFVGALLTESETA